MTTNHQTRHRRSLLALGASGAALLAFAVALAAAIDRPTPGFDLERAVTTGTVPMARATEHPWGRDTLRSHRDATPKAAPVVGPGLPAAVVVLATQRPFVAAPALRSPPKVPDAYRGAIPPPAQRTR